MSVLLELIREAPPEDRKAAAEMLMQGLPKKAEPEEDGWFPLEALRSSTPGHKSKNWIQYNILDAYPETRAWSTDPHPGKGRSVQVYLSEAKKWLHQHSQEIDWNQPEP